MKSLFPCNVVISMEMVCRVKFQLVGVPPCMTKAQPTREETCMNGIELDE